jgi:uncharacterized DUF497 family protein
MHNPTTDIEFDPIKAKANRFKHGVSFAQAEEALQDFMAVTMEDPDAIGEQRFVTLGADANGRLLIVVYTLRGANIRVISARKASKGETRQYHAQ